MITITAPKDFSFFSTHAPLSLETDFPWFGVAWERDEDRMTFTNPVVKIPGGNFYPTLSEPGLPTFKVKMVTNNLSLKLLDKTVDRLGVICTEADGTARPLLITKNYDPDWSRKVRLTKITTDVGKKFNSITIEFSLISNLWYGPVKKKTRSSGDLTSGAQLELSLNRAPADFYLDISGNIKNITLRTSLNNAKSLTYRRNQINGSYAVETENHIMKINGVEKMSDLPPNFKLYKGLSISGSGSYNQMKLEYRETKV